MCANYGFKFENDDKSCSIRSEQIFRQQKIPKVFIYTLMRSPVAVQSPVCFWCVSRLQKNDIQKNPEGQNLLAKYLALLWVIIHFFRAVLWIFNLPLRFVRKVAICRTSKI